MKGSVVGMSQQPSYTVEISHDTAYINEIITLTYTLTNVEGQYQQPDLSIWEYMGPNTSIRSSWINGVSKSEAHYTYQMIPREAGDLTIDGAQVLMADDTEVTFPPVVVHILPTRGRSISEHTMSITQLLTDQEISPQDSLQIKLRKLKTKKI